MSPIKPHFAPLRFATRDLDDLEHFYDGRLLEDPVVTKRLTNLFWGSVEVEDVHVRLANADGALTAWYLSDPRGQIMTFTRYDRINQHLLDAYRGQITTIALDMAALDLDLTNLDTSVFETRVPRGTVDTATFPLAIDVGHPLPVILGTVPKVPLLYVREDLLQNQFDYLVGRGDCGVTAAYRNGMNKTFYPIQASEYTRSTTLYPGFTVLRFPVAQWDFNNQRHQLWADVVGLQPERNFARAVRTLLSDPDWGLGLPIDENSFTVAEMTLVGVGGLFCDGILSTPTQAQSLLSEWLMVRGMRLGLTASGAWTCTVDTPRTQVEYALGDGLGTGPANVLTAGPRKRPSVIDSMQSLTIHYRLDTDGSTHLFTQTRSAPRPGRLKEFWCNFVRAHGTADRIADYMFKTHVAGEETVDITAEVVMLTEGDLVTLDVGALGYTGDTLQVQEVGLAQKQIAAVLRGYDPAAYTYVPGALPGDGTLGDGEDFSRTAPVAASALSVVSSGVELFADGTWVSFIVLQFTTPTRNYAHALIRFRKYGTALWSAGQTVTQAGAAVQVKIVGLVTNQAYDFTVTTVNAFGLISVGDPLLLNQIAPQDTTAPGVPTGVSAVVGTGAAVSLSWAPVTAADLDEYGVYRHTVNVPSGAVKIAEVRTTRFIDANVILGTPYFYWVTAIDRSENQSAKSAMVTATPTGTAHGTTPGTPAALTLASAGAYQSGDGGTRAYAIVNVPAMPPQGAILNILFRLLGQTPWRIAEQRDAGGGTSRIDDLATGLQYELAAQAFNAFGKASVVGATLAHTAANDAVGPAVPTGLVATVGTGKSVSLNWADVTAPDFSEYGIYRHTVNAPESATKIAEVRASRFVDVEVMFDTPYFYWVTAFDRSENQSAKSAGVTATPSAISKGDVNPSPPSTPSAPTFSSESTYQAGDGTTLATIVIVNPAMPVPGVLLNLLYRRAAGTVQYQIADQVSEGGGTSRVDDLSPGVAYEFASQAYSAFGIGSAISATLLHTAPSDAVGPAVPTGLVATVGTGKSVSLNWADVTEPDFSEYGVYRHTQNLPLDATKIAETRASRFVDVEVTFNTLYFYWVTAFDRSENESAKSVGISAKPKQVGTDGVDLTPPSQPATFAKVAEGVYTAGDGTIFAYLDFILPALPTGGVLLNLLYKAPAAEAYLIAGQSDVGAVTLRLDDLTPGRAYDVAVQAASCFGTLSLRRAATASPFVAPGDTAVPATPSALSATQHDGLIVQITATFTETPTWGTSRLYRNTTNDSGTATIIDRGKVKVFTDQTVSYGVTYYYWVKVVSLSGIASGFSPVASVTVTTLGTPGITPGAVSGSASVSRTGLAQTSHVGWEALPGLSSPLTTIGGVVLITVSLADFYIANFDQYTPRTCVGGVRIVRDGTVAIYTTVVRHYLVQNDLFFTVEAAFFRNPMSLTFLDRTVATGEHTYRVEWGMASFPLDQGLAVFDGAMQLLELKR